MAPALEFFSNFRKSWYRARLGDGGGATETAGLGDGGGGEGDGGGGDGCGGED
jgi:hypothetical protein